MIFLVISCITILSFGYIFAMKKKPSDFIKNKSVILFVIAHPDDECMFFGPTILNVLKKECEVHMLCLSSGGFRFESAMRKQELRESCQTFGIPSGNLIIIEHSYLPDNPKRVWNRVQVSSIILKYFLRLSANIVISFDEGGVSGHSNHIAISEGLKYLHAKSLLPPDSDIYLLKSVSLLRKYVAFLLVCISYFCEEFCFISNYKDILTTQKCMKLHYSQYVWFRKLYIIFSSYVYVNTLRKL